MKQQQQSMPGHHSFQRQPRTSSLGQRIFGSLFWSSFWLPFGLVWFIAFLFNSWWRIPLYLSLPILFSGYVALIVVAVRQYHQFQRADWPSPPRNEPKESWEDQAQRQRFPVPTSLIHSHSTGKTSASRCRILGKSDRFPFSCKQSGRGDMSDLLSVQCRSIERTCEALQLNVQLVAQLVGSSSMTLGQVW